MLYWNINSEFLESSIDYKKKFTIGHFFHFSLGMISWRSNQQRIVTMSLR